MHCEAKFVIDDRFAPLREQLPYQAGHVFLNTSTLGLSPQIVLDTITDSLQNCEEKNSSGQHDDNWQTVKGLVADLLGCSAEEIAFTRNTTEGTNIVCNGLPFKPGDEIITSSHEHVGNIFAWLARAQRDDLKIKVFAPAPTAAETLARIESLLTAKTRALSIPHVSCANGQVLPVDAIGTWAQDRGLWYFVDGAQAVGMIPVNIASIGCHAYATSGHKWLLGPKGMGLLYIRADALDLIRPTSVGAYSNDGPFDLATGQLQFHPSAQRYEYGTQSGAFVAGLGAALKWLGDIGFDTIHRHDHALANKLRSGLQTLDIEILSPDEPESRSAIVTFKLANMPYAELQSFMMNNYRLRVRGIYEGGLNAIRVSPHLYNTAADVEQVLAAVEAAQKM